jgi:flagellar biosynthesis GTPase FlhF
MSTFSHAGVSRLNGTFKVRYANSADRVKVLIKGGHTDIDLIELKFPMTKEEAVAYLLSIDFDNGNAEVRACLEAENGKRNEEAEPKEPKPAKERKPRVAKAKKAAEAEQTAEPAVTATQPTLTKAEILAQLAELDEAPF